MTIAAAISEMVILALTPQIMGASAGYRPLYRPEIRA